VIDAGTEFGAMTARRLREDEHGWLVTTQADGTPDPVLVWFLWQGESFLIYSEPGTRKLRNLDRNPKAALHLDSDGKGGGAIVVTGEAGVSADPPATEIPEYIAKYRDLAARHNWTPEVFARIYSVPIRLSFGRQAKPPRPPKPR
jgi:PPOX class probable F420-dependent enzyme